MKNQILALAMMISSAAPALAQAPAPPPAAAPDYVVGAQDVLLITSYDQPDLTGKFVVDTDGSFTFPMIGRVTVGGMTLRAVEASLKKQLMDAGLFLDPQVSVAVSDYRSQKVFIVGEVRTPGAYTMSGAMRLVEALALAGSTLPTASGDAVIMPAAGSGMIAAVDPCVAASELDDESAGGQVRVSLRDLANGVMSGNIALNDGDTIFVLRAENVYVFGQVKNAGAYALPQGATVLQALALAGGVTDRGAVGRIRIARVVNGTRVEIDAELTDEVLPQDTIVVPERFF
jgi:polysaccharide export outer membrane protein